MAKLNGKRKTATEDLHDSSFSQFCIGKQCDYL